MNLPDILNVAIGLVVLYFLLSTIASLLLDLLTTAARYREEILYVSINRLLVGESDKPWNITKLVLDRIASRLPLADGPFKIWLVLRKRWRQVYEIGELPATAANQDPDAWKTNKAIVVRFWKHPKISSLASPDADAPAAIEPATFAQVLVDIAVPRGAQGELPDNRLLLERALGVPSGATPKKLLTILRSLALSSEIPPEATGDALWTPFRANIAAWFKESSKQATNLYKKSMQRLLLGTGFALALLSNADSLRVADVLAHNRPLGDATAAYAATLVAEQSPPKAVGAPAAAPAPGGPAPAPAPLPAPKAPAPAPAATAAAPVAPSQPVANASPVTPAATAAAEDRSDVVALRKELASDIQRLRKLEQIGFPIGWVAPDWGFAHFDEWINWTLGFKGWVWFFSLLAVSLGLVAIKVVGLGVTALAVAQGAPFWYDLMQKLVGLRRGAASGADAPAPASDSGSSRLPAPLEGKVAPATVMPLEIGYDLAAPATGFSARKAYWLAVASAAAYSPRREIESLVLQSWRFHRFEFFDRKGTQAFFAADEKIVLVAFRGTELTQLQDIVADADAMLVDFVQGGKRKVHRGFKDALDCVWNDLSAQVLTFIKPEDAKPPRQVFITGHSLGGALATLMFAQLMLDEARPIPTLYTYGCPRVGNSDFAAELDRRYPERIHRIVNGPDAVPTVPPLPVYHHAGRMLSFEADNSVRTEISGLSRLLDLTSTVTAKGLKETGREALDAHGVAHYVARCEQLAKKG